MVCAEILLKPEAGGNKKGVFKMRACGQGLGPLILRLVWTRKEEGPEKCITVDQRFVIAAPILAFVIKFTHAHIRADKSVTKLANIRQQ